MTPLQQIKLLHALLPFGLYGKQVILTSESRAELQTPDQPLEVEDTTNQSPFRFCFVKK